MKIVNYEETMGEIGYPEGFKETLVGLTIEQQMKLFRTTTWTRYANTNWNSRTYKMEYCPIDRDSSVKAIVVQDGLIVGALILDERDRELFCKPEDSVCTYYASDNNGAGYKERMDFTWLVCVPKDFAEDK